jgi:CRP/FNR family cyclic AMP-dependent transcriptional regulator
MSAPAAEAPGLKAAADALDDEELHTLSAHATEQTYHKNTVVVNEGDRSNSIFVILSGRVKVFLRNSDGREMVINVLGPREYFGELVIDEGARSASIATLETSRFMIVTKDDFKALVTGNPDFALKLINRLMQRVRALTDNIRSLALLDVYGRVARLLLELASEQDGRLVVVGKAHPAGHRRARRGVTRDDQPHLQGSGDLAAISASRTSTSRSTAICRAADSGAGFQKCGSR